MVNQNIVYCICGHHVTDHETLQSFIAIATPEEPPTVTCRGGNKPHAIRNCECDEFRPYRTVGEDNDYKEAIEKQIWEVTE